jgi:hypothetical protein
MNTRLVRTFAPLSDESGLGYYRRLSAANGLSGWRELAKLSEVSGARSGLFSRPEHVARMLGIDNAACRMASAREELALGWRGLRRAGFDAICPHCLNESVHIRLGWDHAYVVACPVHESLLIDKCGGCGQRLPDHREQLDYCPCGHHLLADQTKRATAAQLWVATTIVSKGAHSGRWLPAMDDVHLELFSLLVRNLCQLFDPALTVTRENAAAPRTVLEAAEFLRPLEYLLQDWPRGFESHIRDRIASGPPNARTLNTKLRKWYLRLKEVAVETALGQFIDVVHQVATQEYVGVLALDHVVGHEGRTAAHYMLPEAAARIGVHRATLVKAVHAGEVASITRPYANQGVAREISIAEVDAIAAARKRWIGEKEARELLNVPESVFKNLVQAGILVPDGTGRTDIRRGAPIERAAIEALRSRLMSGALRDGQGDERRLKLRELHARRLGDKQAIVRLLQAIANGNVLPLERAKTVGELEFLESDMATFFSSKVVDAGLSVQALSKTTGWKWESISHWIDKGLLDSERAVLRGQPCRVVSPEQLLKFTQTYLPLADLARLAGTKASSLFDKLGGVTVLGGKPLPNGAQRGGLVRMADLVQLALRQCAPQGCDTPPQSSDCELTPLNAAQHAAIAAVPPSERGPVLDTLISGARLCGS